MLNRLDDAPLSRNERTFLQEQSEKQLDEIEGIVRDFQHSNTTFQSMSFIQRIRKQLRETRYTPTWSYAADRYTDANMVQAFVFVPFNDTGHSHQLVISSTVTTRHSVTSFQVNPAKFFVTSRDSCDDEYEDPCTEAKATFWHFSKMPTVIVQDEQERNVICVLSRQL